MPSARLTLRQLLDKARWQLCIPEYQRRYIWGQERPGEKDSATCLTLCLNEAWQRQEPYFLQGVTFAAGKPAELVDGQQRFTYLYLLLKALGSKKIFKLSYQCRPEAQKWLANCDCDDTGESADDTQDICFFKKTLRIIKDSLDPAITADYVLDNVYFLCIKLDEPGDAISAFAMMNTAKLPMQTPDIIKADIMRMASDPEQPNATEWELADLRTRYATEWESWARWWNRPDVKEYYADLGAAPLDLLLRLCLRSLGDSDLAAPLTYEEFRAIAASADEKPYHAAKHLFYQLRRTQKKFEESYADAAAYNRIRAILLLQKQDQRLAFLSNYFVDMAIDAAELERYYKLSFLGMTIEEIARGDDPAVKFDELLASLSMVDIYHTEAKRDAYNLLLRLNIDEDIKLGRKFDFSIWNNRSLEHIFSKSKVWHFGPNGEPLDGNDNPLRMPLHKLQKDPSYMLRDQIVNLDGAQLSEHCIGNLVLLYGQNNAEFGNVPFDKKKLMFLAPGNLGVFKSRNLLHSVCVFAGNSWTSQSIVDNYNLTLKNLKLYYGYK